MLRNAKEWKFRIRFFYKKNRKNEKFGILLCKYVYNVKGFSGMDTWHHGDKRRRNYPKMRDGCRCVSSSAKDVSVHQSSLLVMTLNQLKSNNENNMLLKLYSIINTGTKLHRSFEILIQ